VLTFEKTNSFLYIGNFLLLGEKTCLIKQKNVIIGGRILHKYPRNTKYN